MRKLRVQKRPKCKGWYIRPNVNGKSKWVFLSLLKAEAEEMAKHYEMQRYRKKVEGYNSDADVSISIDKYLEEKCSTTLTTKKSRARYTAPMRRFQGFLLDKKIKVVSDIREDSIIAYLSSRQQNDGISDKTWNMERGVIFNFLKYCKKKKWIEVIPLEFPPKKFAPTEITHLTEHEVIKFLEYLKTYPTKVCFYELISTIVYTGMRVGEAVRIRKEDVFLKNRCIRISEKVINGEVWRPKDKETRNVPIPEPILPIIEEQMKNSHEFLLFPNTRGNIVSERHVLEFVKNRSAEAGLKPINTHSLRHSFTSIAISKGYNDRFVQEVLGHSSPFMTRRYSHLSPNAITNEFKNLNYAEGNSGS